MRTCAPSLERDQDDPSRLAVGDLVDRLVPSELVHRPVVCNKHLSTTAHSGEPEVALTPHKLDAFLAQERLDQVEHARELREDDGLLALSALLDVTQNLDDHACLRRMRRHVRVWVRSGPARRLVHILAVDAHVVLPCVVGRQTLLADLARLARNSKTAEESSKIIALVFIVLASALRIDRLLVVPVVLRDQGGVVAC